MSLVNPVLVVIATWWLGTGVVLYLQQRIQRGGIRLALTLALLSVASLFTLKITSAGIASWQSYAGFVAAVVLWGCLELSYYTGLITGVHQQHCPRNCDTARRFRLALGASIWHEISVLIAACVVVTLCWQSINPVGLYTFVVLWLMRWSAKLNLFLGVPNFNTDWFPEHLAYAHSYMKHSRVSLFYPLSVLLAGIFCTSLMIDTVTAPPSQALITALPCVLLILAILEHLFLALPIADSALWNKVFAREDNGAVRSLKQQALKSDDVLRSRSAPTLLKSSTSEPVSVTIGHVETPAPVKP